jgi:hypothetical protein
VLLITTVPYWQDIAFLDYGEYIYKSSFRNVLKSIVGGQTMFFKVCDNCEVERAYVPIVLDHGNEEVHLQFCVMCYEDLKPHIRLDLYTS